MHAITVYLALIRASIRSQARYKLSLAFEEQAKPERAEAVVCAVPAQGLLPLLPEEWRGRAPFARRKPPAESAPTRFPLRVEGGSGR